MLSLCVFILFPYFILGVVIFDIEKVLAQAHVASLVWAKNAHGWYVFAGALRIIAFLPSFSSVFNKFKRNQSYDYSWRFCGGRWIYAYDVVVAAAAVCFSVLLLVSFLYTPYEISFYFILIFMVMHFSFYWMLCKIAIPFFTSRNAHIRKLVVLSFVSYVH